MCLFPVSLPGSRSRHGGFEGAKERSNVVRTLSWSVVLVTSSHLPFSLAQGRGVQLPSFRLKGVELTQRPTSWGAGGLSQGGVELERTEDDGTGCAIVLSVCSQPPRPAWQQPAPAGVSCLPAPESKTAAPCHGLGEAELPGREAPASAPWPAGLGVWVTASDLHLES